MRSFALAIAALILVSSCTDDPEPIEPTASATTEPTAPSMPEQAREGSPEGAAAFVSHYIRILNYAASTGDLAELSRLSADECDGCRTYIDLYRDVHAAGGYFRGGDWKASNVELEIHKKTTDVFVTVHSDGGKVKPSADRKLEDGKPVNGDVVFEVDTAAKDRRVKRFERLEE